MSNLTGIGITLTVDGDDLVCASTEASYFGDPQDVASGQDNGIGANGFKYVDKPYFIGFALPLQRNTHHLESSPIPHGLPIRNADGSHEGIQIRVYSPDTGKDVTGYLVDIGPTGGLNRGMDMLIGTVHALGLDPKKGLWNVRYRIIGGAKYLGS